MRIVFTGHRDAECADASLDLIVRQFPGAVWLHGGNQSGFDARIALYAAKHGINTIVFRPNYEQYPPTVAPLKRNDVLLKLADVVVALYDGRKEGGTYYMVKHAEKLKIPIIRITRKV